MTSTDKRPPSSADPPGRLSLGTSVAVPDGAWVAAAIVGAVWALQWQVGAFATERSLHSDEAAHFMNALVLRDYLWLGLGESPMAFAVDYYRHYPKIAPFMWPPLFHGLLALVLLPGWPPMPAAILFVGVCTAWTAWRLFHLVTMFAPKPVAAATVALFLVTPVVVTLSSSVMIDILIAALAIEAAYWLGRFSHQGRMRDAVLFGLMTALACAAKGNGLSAALAAMAFVLVTGRLDLLRRPGLYVAAAITVVVAAPPLYLAWALDASLGDFGAPWPYLGERVALYSGFLWRELGGLALSLAAVGTVVAFRSRRPWLTEATRHQTLALVAMTIGAIVFHLLNPHVLSTGRYITLAIAPLLGLAALGLVALTRAVAAGRRLGAVQGAAVAVLAVAHLATGANLRLAEPPLGYRDAMAFLHAHDLGLAGRRVLLVSNEGGEGAGVTEAALLGLSPRPMVLRGSKVLAEDDWMGNHPEPVHADAEALLADLEALHVDYVIVDDAPAARNLTYWPMVAEALTVNPGRVQLLRTTEAQPGRREGPLRPLRIYRLLQRAAGPPRHLEFKSTPIIGTP